MQLFTALARTAERRVAEFKPTELAKIAWAFEKAGHPDAKLFTALATVAEGGMGNLITEGLANTAWARATASQLVNKDLTLTPAAEMFYSQQRPPSESQHEFVESV